MTLQSVDVGERSIESFRGVAFDDLLDDLREKAAGLRGLRVLHLNATQYGGGVSELLRSVVPLLNDLGLSAEWRLISGDDAFFNVTKAMHNGLQGAPRGLTQEERDIYLDMSARNAARIEDLYDVIFVHDPQPAALRRLHGKGQAHWVWRCHIDTSAPNSEVWQFLHPYLSEYDAAVFTMAEFAPPDLGIERVAIIPPAIDPMSPKNLPLPENLARQVLDWIGVRPNQLLVTQVSRFDQWKDPFGVTAAYRLAREQLPNLQLALVGSMALDDPEAWQIYRDLRTTSEDDPLIHIFTNLTGVGNVEVNAFQRLSDVIVQKSIREGFGLVVSEALWKGTPVVAGRTGGIPLQMPDGTGGTLVDSVEGCATAIVDLIRDRSRARELAALGQERVRELFLLPRLVRDELVLMASLVGDRQRPTGGLIHDVASGLFSEGYLNVTLDRELARVRQGQGSVVVAVLGIDHPNQAAARLGKVLADRLKQELGQVVRKVIRPGDIAARLPSGEVVVVYTDTSPGVARALTEEIRAGISDLPIQHELGGIGPVTVSAGLAVARGQELDTTSLLHEARSTLARADRDGGDRLYEPETTPPGSTTHPGA